MNIVEKNCVNKANKIGTTLGSLNDSDVIDVIVTQERTPRLSLNVLKQGSI